MTGARIDERVASLEQMMVIAMDSPVTLSAAKGAMLDMAPFTSFRVTSEAGCPSPRRIDDAPRRAYGYHVTDS